MARSRGGVGAGGGGGGGASAGGGGGAGGRGQSSSSSRSRTLSAPFIKRLVSTFMAAATDKLNTVAASASTRGEAATTRRAAAAKLKHSSEEASKAGSKLLQLDGALYSKHMAEVAGYKVRCDMACGRRLLRRHCRRRRRRRRYCRAPRPRPAPPSPPPCLSGARPPAQDEADVQGAAAIESLAKAKQEFGKVKADCLARYKAEAARLVPAG